MADVTEIMQMCRLCLVKEQVNIPIFEEPGDVHEVLLKISACLPVKVSREDNLPKKVCDGCGYKLDLLYQFWNTASNAEKQLVQWLTAAGVDPKHNSTAEDILAAVQPKVVLKQEPNADDSLSLDTQSYILQQQQIPVYQQKDEFKEYTPTTTTTTTTTVPTPAKKKATASPAAKAPASKRPKRATRSKRAVKDSSEDEDDLPLAKAAITKTEQVAIESDDDDGDMGDMGDPDFGTGDDEDNDTDQPGPSGVGKSSNDAPSDDHDSTQEIAEIACDYETEEVYIEAENDYQCEVCDRIFPDRKEYLEHHVSRFGSTFSCCRCKQAFKTTTELYNHYETHRGAEEEYEPEQTAMTNVTYGTTTDDDAEEEVQYEYIEETVDEDGQTTTLVYADEEDEEHVIDMEQGEGTIGSTSELLYILDDDNQCVNEIVIESGEPSSNTRTIKSTNKADFSVVQVDHGYIMPACFKGQLQTKKRPRGSQPMASTSKSHVLTIDNEDARASSVLVTSMQPSTSTGGNKMTKPTPTKVLVPRVSLNTAKRRQVHVPDFSATSYELIDANSDIDMAHYKCLRCEQLFINKFVFFRHIEKGKCYIKCCDMCDATFSKNSEFYDHYVSEHTERAICHFCFRTFLYEKNVKEHMLRHLDQFRHRCEECNKGFYTVREYRNHYKNRHMGIRHKCTECGRSFADEYYFKRHLASHGLALFKAEEIETE